MSANPYDGVARRLLAEWGAGAVVVMVVDGASGTGICQAQAEPDPRRRAIMVELLRLFATQLEQQGERIARGWH